MVSLGSLIRRAADAAGLRDEQGLAEVGSIVLVVVINFVYEGNGDIQESYRQKLILIAKLICFTG